MPYWSAQASRGVTALSPSIDMTVSPSPPWKAGQTVTVKVTVKSNGNPVANTPVWLWLYSSDAKWRSMITQLYTDSTGSASVDWSIEWSREFENVDTGARSTLTLPCRSWMLEAAAVMLGVSTRTSCSIAYPTRISIYAPDTVIAGQAFTVSGELEYLISPEPIKWGPLKHKRVEIYCNGTKIAEVETADNGTYEVKVIIGRPGTYTLKAVFPGEGLTAGAAALAKTTVGTVGGLMSPATSPLPQMIAGGLMLLAVML